MKSLTSRAASVLAAAVVLVAVSCGKELARSCEPGDEVQFRVAGSCSAQGTKAAYDGTNDLQINWQDDDEVRIVCAQCSETQDALYKAVYAQSNGQAGLELVSPSIGLRWGGSTTSHNFYAAYPGSRSISGNTLSAIVNPAQGGGTISEDASGNWTVAPSMSNMALVSKMTALPTSDALTFDFTPLTTAIKMTITNKRGAAMNVKSISLEATATGMCLSGSYSADLDGTWAAPSDVCTNSWTTPATFAYANTYPACTGLTGGGTIVSIATPASASRDYITVAVDKTLTATFFIQPTTHVYDLKFKITFADDGILTTVIKRVDKATDAENRITFPRHTKSYVSGIFVPEGAQWSVKLDESDDLSIWQDDGVNITLGGEVSQ